MSRCLADAFVTGGRNIRVHTTPGRSVQFIGGHAQIFDGRDMVHMFQSEGIRVYPRVDAMPWAPEWLAQVDQIKAEVFWPDGWAVEHENRGTYSISPESQSDAGDSAVNPPNESGAVSTIDLTSRPWKIRPEDLLEEPHDDTGPVGGTDDSGGTGAGTDAGQTETQAGNDSGGPAQPVSRPRRRG